MISPIRDTICCVVLIPMEIVVIWINYEHPKVANHSSNVNGNFSSAVAEYVVILYCKQFSVLKT